MSAVTLAQLTDALRGIRDRLQQGGSWLHLLLGFVLVGAIVVVSYLLARRQDKVRSPRTLHDSQQLFEGLLHALQLTDGQRDLLRTLVSDLELPQPAALLISPDFFDEHTQTWQRRMHRPGEEPSPDTAAEQFQRIRRVLFPAN
ncbi:MAG TPA: hypothetical protein PKK06_13740 [Phycisphaerae bacterium]|nr:hypothetical protein [Phycisphaerae bacterium]HNU46291.1 hypothetical protein [Phycisphaerae bacterium]